MDFRSVTLELGVSLTELRAEWPRLRLGPVRFRLERALRGMQARGRSKRTQLLTPAATLRVPVLFVRRRLAGGAKRTGEG